MPMRYSYASPNASIVLWVKPPLPKFSSPIASRSFTSFSLRLATVGPSLALLTSTSAKRPLMSSSESAPTADASMFVKTRDSVSLRFSSWRARSRTLANRSCGRMKNPFSFTTSARACSASSLPR